MDITFDKWDIDILVLVSHYWIYLFLIIAFFKADFTVLENF